MTELLHHAVDGFNLPITILLGLMGLFWIISALGAIDFDTVDVALGLDTDVDTGVEFDADAEVHAQSEHGGISGVLHGVLKFLGVADAPLMFGLTVYILMLWAANLAGTILFNKAGNSVTGTIVFGSAVIAAFVLTRLSVLPLRPFLKHFTEKEKQIPVLGRSGVVRSGSISESERGQVEAQGGLLLNARTATGTGALSKGDAVLVIGKEDDPDHDIYIVRSHAIETTSATTDT